MLLEEYGLTGDLEPAAGHWLPAPTGGVRGRGRRRQTGNFPWAFSHLTLFLTVLAISTAGAKVEQGAV